jgi:hypothetical protein
MDTVVISAIAGVSIAIVLAVRIGHLVKHPRSKD